VKGMNVVGGTDNDDEFEFTTGDLDPREPDRFERKSPEESQGDTRPGDDPSRHIREPGQ
jgi:hypothetical protein